MNSGQLQGTIYLICFDKPFGHARHYLGWAVDHHKRLRRHRKGIGAKLLRAVQNAGIGYVVVRTWQGDRKFERKLKDRNNRGKLCPRCNPTSWSRNGTVKEVAIDAADRQERAE